jgi:cytoskeleton protein RodZ
MEDKENRVSKGAFGEHMKREREMRGVSLDEISTATRIATRFLRAIEDEQWNLLPGGVFNRGFVRAVARYLGLDEEDILAEYSLAVGDRPKVPVWTGSPPAVTSEQPWLAWILSAVAILALLIGGWFGVRRFSAWRATRHAARTAATASALRTSSAAQTSPRNDGSPAGSSEPNASPNSATTGKADSPAAASSGPASEHPGAFVLKIQASKATEVKVESDGHLVLGGDMQAGEVRTFAAREEFQVTAHDAAALVLELNGHRLDPIGPSGRVGEVTLRRDALKVPMGGNH